MTVPDEMSAEKAATWEYGVAHVLTDGVSVMALADRDQADSAVARCQDDGAACYLVRRPREWEKVPDGE